MVKSTVPRLICRTLQTYPGWSRGRQRSCRDCLLSKVRKSECIRMQTSMRDLGSQPVSGVKKLYTSSTGPFLKKIPKYCFNTPNGTAAITLSILFRRLKDTVFPSRIGNSNSHKLEAHSKSQYSVHNEGPRGEANAQRFFNWWAKCRCFRVPSKVCCGEVAL